MGKTLIITEKPSVAREYAAILKVQGSYKGYIENDSYVITWCVGHLIEMSYPEKYDEKYAKWKMEDLPFLPDTYRYAVISNVKEQYETVHSLMHRDDIEGILYAGDSGREGEVIIQLIRNFGGVRKGMIERRVWIDSCTEEEILRGIREAKPIEAYDNLANAGIMRAIEDYAMGINFSRALSVKYGRMINQEAQTKKYAAIAIGRVMTCVLGMVVRREREIRAFQETEFFRVLGHFKRGENTFSGEFKAVEGSAYEGSPKLYKENGFLKKEDAEAFIASLATFQEGEILSLSKSTEKKKPPLLFNLAELQAECSKRFKINPEQTLKVAQNLYEKKFTTYPRTDARVLTTAIAKEIGKNIAGLKHYPPTANFASAILEQKLYANLDKTQYTDDKKVTDHYAIIPTGVLNGYPSLTELEKKVYDLIVRRFLSIFYPPAVFRKAALTVRVGSECFFTNAKVLKEPGFFEIAKPQKENKDEASGESRRPTEEAAEVESEESEETENDSAAFLSLIEHLKKGDRVEVAGFSTKTGKTSPPKRYTSGSMVLAMENAGQLIEDEELRAQIKGAGIGTSATRAGIIEKLVKIRYLELNPKSQILTPGRLGEMIYEVVVQTLPSMLNAEMTASWEKGLSKVEQGEITAEEYREILERYVRKYIEAIRRTDRSRDILSQIRANVKSTAAKATKTGKGVKNGSSSHSKSV
ncbi:MAG: type IA DNA topoisomerase [Lachnospiraceae bacterium]|nr:type IA DNA topoisomerase [Lachnospiraceae bacterium]